jgi:hypothetical protein
VRTIVGVMGGAIANEQVTKTTYELGRLIAEQDWVLLNGGRDAGVMAASARGASEAGGLVVGVLPYDDTHGVSPYVDIAIPTGMGDARNAVNVLASHVVIALPGGAGTVSEIALALKSGKTVVNCGLELGAVLGPYYDRGQLVDALSPAEAIAAVHKALPEELL